MAIRKKIKKLEPPKPAPKVECTWVDPQTGSERAPLIGRKRTHQILVQCLKGDQVMRQAIFSDLRTANSYIEMRERIDGLTAVPSMIELDPQIVGTWTLKVTGNFKDDPQATEGSGS